jgi:hypothetical protein
MHDLIDDIDIDVSFFLSLHILVMFSEFEDESRFLDLAIHSLMGFVEKSEEYICFSYMELISEVYAKSCKVYFPSRCGSAEMEILPIDECDIFRFCKHILIVLI